MKKTIFILFSSILFIFGSLGKLAYAASDTESQMPDYKQDWSYQGANSPEQWGGIEDKYILCEAGKEQSPIDLRDAQPTALDELAFDYNNTSLHLVNIGYTLEYYPTAVKYPAAAKDENVPENYLTFMGKQYQLQELHFHAPSEHTLNGEQYPMEVHLVHQDADGNLAVVGVLMNVGTSNDILTSIFEQIPAEKYQPFVDPTANIDLLSLLPQNKTYYHYRGSLTTPPCGEGVNWIVMAEQIEISPEHIQAYQDKVIEYNARPIQKLNQRDLLISTD